MQSGIRTALRPESLEEYIGQEPVKELLRVAMISAKERKAPLEHILLNGPPGLGKTTLSRIIAREMGWRIRETIGTALRSQESVKNLFYSLEEKEVVFIDEVHRLILPIQELIYPVLEDGILHSSFGGTPVSVEVETTTVIGATTNMGKLSRPFQDRFGMVLQLEYYNEAELTTIAEANAVKLEMRELQSGAIRALVERSRSTPRTVNRLLRWVRDFRHAYGLQYRDLSYEWAKAMLWTKFKIDRHGLLPLDRRVLKRLAEVKYGIGSETLAMLVQEDVDTITGTVEPYLLRIGFIERRPTGRVITAEGKKHLEEVRKHG